MTADPFSNAVSGMATVVLTGGIATVSQMRARCEQLGGLSEAEQFQALRGMILERAEQVTDAQYVRLWGTNLTMAASMPD